MHLGLCPAFRIQFSSTLFILVFQQLSSLTSWTVTQVLEMASINLKFIEAARPTPQVKSWVHSCRLDDWQHATTISMQDSFAPSSG